MLLDELANLGPAGLGGGFLLALAVELDVLRRLRGRRALLLGQPLRLTLLAVLLADMAPVGERLPLLLLLRLLDLLFRDQAGLQQLVP